jgi:acylphosphatase
VSQADEDAVGQDCREWVVRGRVQGVGFRWYVLNHAQSLGIRGWVANTSDGSVEVVGLATSATLDEFDALLEKGPPAARVQQLERRSIPHDYVGSKSFIIKH